MCKRHWIALMNVQQMDAFASDVCVELKTVTAASKLHRVDISVQWKCLFYSKEQLDILGNSVTC